MALDDYIVVIEGMLARKEKITLQTVRNQVGSGSYSTISEAIKLVLNRGLIPAEISGPVPESLASEAQHLWQEACRLASETVASERLALHSTRVEMQDSQRELMALADALTRQVDDLAEQLAAAKAAQAAAEKRAEEADATVKATRQVIKELGIKPADSSKSGKGKEAAEGTLL